MELTYTENEISEVATKVLKHSASKIFLFYGEMGVGKTTLINEIVKQLGVLQPASSPSFAIVNEYDLREGTAYHFDFYRINNLTEAFDIGFEDYLYSDNYVFIEWPDKIDPLLPKDATKIYIKTNPNRSRNIKIMPMR
ncbi:tRNA (adenosine(37)-N6)-threonylcarbamoyltransferase complex ATPase subunit type 1 TsaE [Aequorivita flava]|uniref:tRNA threonylcarbamoyladenosine biosynthesis protein TsaE n=1 Tax=Aequorivita flava TaxID=3114371 RepID=A0AB35YN84_9FLAO